MAANKPFRFGPIALTTTLTTNILSPGTTTGGVNSTSAPFNNLFITIRAIRLVNKTGSSATVSFWLGATGANSAGTEVIGQGLAVSANNYLDVFEPFSLYASTPDYLVGGSNTATAISIMGWGEIGVQ